VEIKIEIPQKISNRTIIRSSYTISGYTPKRSKSVYSTDTNIIIFITALLTTAKLWNHSKCPAVYGWIKKMWYIYIRGHHSDISNEIVLITEQSQNWSSSC
jgi:hypothetical protein